MPQSDKITVVVKDASVTFHVYPDGSQRGLFGKRRRIDVEALKQISLVAKAGDCIGVLGRNGSGKSTLCSLIAGNLLPSQGEVLVSSPPTLLGVGAALQPHLSGRTNVRLGLLAMGLSPEAIDEVQDDVAEWADIGPAIDRPLRTYSSGQKARLSFSVSTAIRREILLVDEALSTGDASFSSRARERMNSFLDASGTVFLVSHGPGVIKDYCNRAIWIHEGSLIADGPVEDVARHYSLWSTFTAQGNTVKAEKYLNECTDSYPQKVIFYED